MSIRAVFDELISLDITGRRFCGGTCTAQGGHACLCVRLNQRKKPNDAINSPINMRRKHYPSPAKSLSLTPIVGACLGGALLAGLPATNIRAQGADAARVDKLE